MPAANATSTPRTYHVHRERQRRRILEAAQNLFNQKGIDRVTMAEVVSASALRTSTLYQYFSSKDDIVWAILEEVLADFAARAMNATDSANASSIPFRPPTLSPIKMRKTVRVTSKRVDLNVFIRHSLIPPVPQH